MRIIDFLKLPVVFIKSQGVKLIMKTINDFPDISRIGKISELKLKQGIAELTVKLKGETEPVSISLKYALERNTVCITDVNISKEWLNALADVLKEKYSKIDLSDSGTGKALIALVKVLS